MLWQHCLRTGSRRNLVRPSSFLLLMLVAGSLSAQIQHSTQVRITDDYLELNIRVAGAEIDELFATLKEGMTARLEYRIRVSYPRSRPFRFLGNRLIREFRPAFEASWDPFVSAYVLVGHDGNSDSYEDEAALYARMFSLDAYRIPWSAIRSGRDLVLEISAEYTPIVFVPGLSILSLFTANRSEQSPWSRHTIVPGTSSVLGAPAR